MTGVDATRLRDLTAAILATRDVPESDAALTAEVLVAADLAGIDSHGVSRLGLYVHKLDHGLVRPHAEPRVTVDGGASCVIDGDNGLGMVAARTGMDLAIERAASGIGAAVSVGNSNHFGIAGWYAKRAVEHGMIGIALTNGTNLVAPTFGREPMLGTNPIAVAVPTSDDDRPWLLDMATSTVPAGKLQLAMAAGEPIPEGWAMDADGNPTTDPGAGFGGALLPLGSTRTGSSHKGYGLAVLVDIFAALLSGANYGPHLPGLVSEFDSVANVGHFFAALRVEAFRPLAEFTGRMDEMLGGLRATTPASDAEGVLVAGDPEHAEQERRSRDGIPLDAGTVDTLRALADDAGLGDRAMALLG